MRLNEMFKTARNKETFLENLSSLQVSPVTKTNDKNKGSAMAQAKVVKEAPAKPLIPVAVMNYGTWEIKYRTAPTPSGVYTAMAYNPRLPVIKAEGKTAEEALNSIKAQIAKSKANDDLALKFSKCTVDFNIQFTREIIPHGPTGVRFTKNGDSVVLVVCGEEYLDAFGEEVFGRGADSFTKLTPRRAATVGEGVQLFATKLTPAQITELGLEPYGRYALELTHTDFDYGHRYYNLVYAGKTEGSGDKQRMGVPGLTIAVY